jgi:tetratricopeptide (TPR) repeat protein
MATSPTPPSTLFASASKRNLILCLLLVMCTLGVYNGVTHNGFLNYDDDLYVTSNRHVQAGLNPETAGWALTTFDVSNWHPLTWISYLMDYQIFKMNPAGWHYTSVLLHCANVVLLFLVLFEATQKPWRALAVAAIFSLHPLNVESVAWISERKNVLSMLFLLLALRAYQRYSANPGLGRYAAVFLLFACGLMSKPQVITLPFLLLLWDYWPLGRLQLPGSASSMATDENGLRKLGSRKRESDQRHGESQARSTGWLVLEKLPLLALSAVSAALTFTAQRAGGAVRSANEFPVSVRIENATVAYLDYVRRLFWPTRLAALYPHPGDSLRAWQVGLAVLLVIGVTLLVMISKTRRYLAVGWFWYLGALVPMIGLVQVGQQATADRYMYLPMIGLLIMLCWAAADWAGEAQARTVAVGIAVAMILVALGGLTIRQAALWHDSETLWSRTIAVTGENHVARVNLGQTFLDQGRTEEAAVQFREAVRIQQNDPAAHLNLGNCERRQKNYLRALLEDQAVLRLTSDKQLRAYALVNMGSDYRMLEDYKRAKESYEAGLEINPEAGLAYVGLGIVAQKTGAFDEAVRNYSQAVKLSPTDIGYLLLAQALDKVALPADSRKASEAAKQISPDFERAQQSVRELLAE